MARACRRPVLPTAVAAALLAVALSGCSLTQLVALVPHAETRADDGSITSGGTTDVFSLRAGDCLDDASLAAPPDDEVDGAADRPSRAGSADAGDLDARLVGDDDSSGSQQVDDVSTVPCADPHDFEVYADVTATGDAFPGDDAVERQADDLCGAAFAPFVGADYDDSIYDYAYYKPSEGSWSTGDRTVSCLIGDPAGKTVGSLAGIGR